MSSTPQFASTPHSWETATTTAGGIGANARTGTIAGTPVTGAVLLMTAGANGSRIEDITFTSLGSSSVDVGRIFIVSSGTFYLLEEFAIPAVTATAANVAAASVTISFPNFVVAFGDSVYVSAAVNTSNYSVIAFGGDF
jgi:hypothetical protein